jgi:hypothetical protein
MNNRKFLQIECRIQADIDHYGGNVPEIVVALWEGYLAAVSECDIISTEEYGVLSKMLPSLHNDLIIKLFIGVQNLKDDEE